MPIPRKPAPTAILKPTVGDIHLEKPADLHLPLRVLPAGEIVFYSWTVDGTEPTSQEDLFGVVPRTGVVRRLTDDSSAANPPSDRDPDWSPDHHRIVSMQAVGAAAPYLTVRNSAGAVVSTIAVPGLEPVWMDASTVLASVGRTDVADLGNPADIVAISLTGTVHAVTAVLHNEALSSPDWHPTAGLVAALTLTNLATGEPLGSHLVHASAAAVTAAIHTGTPLPVSAMTVLGATDTWNSSPSWSPDGKSIAYVTLRPCATVEGGAPIMQTDIAIMSTLPRVRGRLVTDDSTASYETGLNDASPIFSPDGQWLAWCRGYEDEWAQIVLQKPSDPATRFVLVADKHRWRGGLSW